MGGNSFDEMLDSLGAVQRRRVLVELLESPDGTELDIADSETETELDGDAASMQHVHLPKLANRDLVDWDRDADVVRRGAEFEEVEPFLELLCENADRLPADWI